MDGEDQAGLQSRVFTFSFDVQHGSLLLVPGWPLVRNGASDRQGPGCKLQLSDVPGASGEP